MRKVYVKPEVLLIRISNQASIMDVSRFKPDGKNDLSVKEDVPTNEKLTKGTTVWDSFYDDEDDEDF